ncbi:MAG TPA: DUF169 domain-containing protein [Clostridiales bacterium]|jgi:uncharacterized protein (DUF169 family)|nr:DUF169 domain-containing protein [Clostridiales bacterium]
MLSNRDKELFDKLELDYPAVAIKFCFAEPQNAERIGKTLSFCQFLKEAQDTGRKFYITKDDDNCFGKMVLGMIDKPPFAASGQAGYDFGVYRTPAPNARLYHMIPTLVRGSVNYVLFSPVSVCDFDADLVIMVASTSKADIIMRATSYISGDLWESRSSCVLSCAWIYAYTYLSGKVNYIITGMHHGLKRRKVYPAGLHMIAIPYQKLPEFLTSLSEMDWELIAMREDEESKRLLKMKMDEWHNMDPDFALHK